MRLPDARTAHEQGVLRLVDKPERGEFLDLALGLGRADLAGIQLESRLAREAPYALGPDAPALGLSRLRFSTSFPPFQYLVTVRLLSPYFFPICVKLGFTPSCRYALGSPMMVLSNRAPSNR